MKSPFVPVIVILAFLASQHGNLACAQSGRGTISGYVTCDACKYQGYAGARVELLTADRARKVKYRRKTDKHGGWKITPIAMGSYILRVTARRHRPYEAELYIPSDSTTRINVKLKKLRRATK